MASASTVATYAICGLLSGIFSRFGKVGATIGFIVGNALWVYFINASTEVIIPFGEIVMASLVLFFLPKRFASMIDDLFDYDNSLEGKDPIGLLAESTIFKLKEVSDVASDMATNVEKDVSDKKDKAGVFIRNLKENTCKKCQNYESCWEQNYHVMYENAFNALEILEDKLVLRENDLINNFCINKKNYVEGANYAFELYKLDKDWQNKVKENQKLVAKQLRGVSKAIDNVQENIIPIKEESNLLGAGYRLEVAVSKTNKKGSKISGDSIEHARLRNGKIILGISDGMGSGELAAKSSKKVLELLEKYLNTGLEKNVALDLINSYMMLGENKENFSTLDVIVFNPFDAESEIVKFGACPTFIMQEGNVKMLSSKSLPVGASINANAETFKNKFERGEFIIMISDGILEANNLREKWVKDLLYSLQTDKPQRIAEIILQEAIDMNYGIAKDDMSVIVAKVC